MSVAIDSHPGKTPPKPISRKFGPAISEVKCVNLALQGGGAHGAFTWGVLDRLLEEPRIEMEGVSATSAGAMNAAVMAHGLATGGRKGAREALEEFWHGVARVSAPFGALQLFEVMSRFLSPYQLNPFNYNPLRQLIRRVIDFDRLRQGSAVKLFLSATNVRTGKVKVFTDKEIVGLGPQANSTPMSDSSGNSAHWGGSERRHVADISLGPTDVRFTPKSGHR